MALKSGVLTMLMQAPRLSNDTASCHMPRMRRSSHPPAQADLPSSLRVQRSTLQTIVSLLPYLWPVGNPGARVRVVVALVFMLLSKVATVYVPVIYGRIIDALAPKDAAAVAFIVPVALILAYGAIRVSAAGFGEIRDALFASVQQRAVRLLALRTFRHLHAVSLRFFRIVFSRHPRPSYGGAGAAPPSSEVPAGEVARPELATSDQM